VGPSRLSPRRLVGLALVAVVASGCGGAAIASPSASSSVAPSAAGSGAAFASGAAGGIFFDDFNYTSPAEMRANGWIIRSKAGWPGQPGAIFDASTVAIVDDTSQSGNRLLELAASTDATTTHQTQVCQARKFLGGTYGARVFFNDAPAAGPDGDQVVETFYLISPYVKANDPDYSELDNEYLPNGGWGGTGETFYVTSWATVTIEPWQADNASDSQRRSLQGWHTMVVQVADHQTKYFLDGAPVAVHGSHFYPDVPMSLNFNLWFISQVLGHPGESRTYLEDIDWTYYNAGAVMAPDQVVAAVADLRSGGTAFKDTVPASGLESPCDL
jgi:hypothetical protein